MEKAAFGLYILNDNVECGLFLMIHIYGDKFYHTCNLTLDGLRENILNKHLSIYT